VVQGDKCSRRPENCGLYAVLKAKENENAKKHYTSEDKNLMDVLIQSLICRWKKDVIKGKVRAPGKLTGEVFEKWVYSELRKRLGEAVSKKERVSLKFGGECRWEADMVYSDGSPKVAIEVKMYFDLQYNLMGKGLLDYSDCKWVFISFHKAGEAAGAMLKQISREYANRFLYVCVVEHPSHALRKSHRLHSKVKMIC